MTEEHLGFISEFLPKYLSPEEQQSLFENIKTDFPYSTDPFKIYRENEDKEILFQGDAIIEIPFPSLNTESGNFDLDYKNGAILSNTCDISSENARNYTPHVIFAAIINLKEFEKFLIDTNFAEEKLKSFVSSIRENKVSSLFYLPQIKNGKEILFEESFIRLDVLTSLPLNFITENYNFDYQRNKGDRIFTFSNYGFYLFLFKLSIHFCRIREGVFRN